jgi:hypothetical protein
MSTFAVASAAAGPCGPRPLPAGIQALAATLAVSEVVPGRTNTGCMILFKQALLHTTLPANDTAALYLFASNTIIPVTRAENKTTRTLHKLYNNVADWGRARGAVLSSSSWHMATGAEHEGLLTFGGDGGTRLGACPVVYVHNHEPSRVVAWQLLGFQVCVHASYWLPVDGHSSSAGACAWA